MSLSEIGTNIHPILSTAKKHLVLQLMQAFETMTVCGRDSLRRVCSPIGYEIIRRRLTMHNSAEYHTWMVDTKDEIYKRLQLTTAANMNRESGDISGPITDAEFSDIQRELVRLGMASADMDWRDLKLVLQRSLDCALIIAKLVDDDPRGVAEFGRRFRELVTDPSHRVGGVDKRFADLVRTLDRLERLATHNDGHFSIKSFNMILSYAVRDHMFYENTLTQGTVLHREVHLRRFESVDFPNDIHILSVLEAGDATVQRALSLCEDGR